MKGKKEVIPNKIIEYSPIFSKMDFYMVNRMHLKRNNCQFIVYFPIIEEPHLGYGQRSQWKQQAKHEHEEKEYGGTIHLLNKLFENIRIFHTPEQLNYVLPITQKMLIMDYSLSGVKSGFLCLPLNSLKVKYKIPTPKLEKQNIIDAVVSCDGKLILTASDMKPIRQTTPTNYYYFGTFYPPTLALWDLNTGESYQTLEIRSPALKLIHFDKLKEEGCYFYQSCSFTSNPLIKYRIHYKAKPPYFEAIQSFKYPSFSPATGIAELLYIIKKESLFVTHQMTIYDVGETQIELYKKGNFRGVNFFSYAGKMKFMLAYSNTIILYNVPEDKIEKEWTTKDLFKEFRVTIQKVRAYGENVAIVILSPFQIYKIYLDSGKSEYIREFAQIGIFEEIE